MKETNSHSFAATFWSLLKKSARRLGKNSPIELAGATAFFATFSLAPLFFILVQLLGIFIGEEKIEKNIVRQFSENTPDQSALQFKGFLEGLEQLQGSWYINAGLFLFLLFSSSRLFAIIRISLYRLWRLKNVQEKELKFKLKSWFLPLALVISAGILLLFGLLIQAFEMYLGDAVEDISVAALPYFRNAYRYLISFLVSWIWFAVVFRYLTDARFQWKTVAVGGLFTAVLFNLGKLVLQPALSVGKIPSVFGASASLVLLQLFVFYSSLLIYYGASFTMEWAKHYQQKITIPEHLRYYTIEEKHTSKDIDEA